MNRTGKMPSNSLSQQRIFHRWSSDRLRVHFRRDAHRFLSVAAADAEIGVSTAAAVPHFPRVQSCSFIWRAGGVRGCFQIKGMSVTFLRTVPASACYFGVYEAVKSALVKPAQRRDELRPDELLMAGRCGGYWLSS